MELLLLLTGSLAIVLGIVGSILPILPGPPIGWIGILCLSLHNDIPISSSFLWGTLSLAVIITVLDYIIPTLFTKKFGGSKKGIWGSTIGMLVGLFFGPLGIILGPFIGAFIGEITNNSKNIQKSLKIAFGTFLGFIFSTGLKLGLSIYFTVAYFEAVWEHKENILR
ncbi:MAG: DUF456 domain-containing protein [Flavicella sp.]